MSSADRCVSCAASWVEIDFHDSSGRPLELRLDIIDEFVAMRTLFGESQEAIEQNAVWFDALIESTNTRLAARATLE